MARAGRVKTLPALLISRLWFNSRMSSCQGDGPGAIPGSRTNSLDSLRVSTRQSFQNSAYSGQHGGSRHFSLWDRGRQAMHLPCKQAYVGALPTGSTSLRPLRSDGRRLPRRSPTGDAGGLIVRSSGLRLGRPISNCGKLDECTEGSLINFLGGCNSRSRYQPSPPTLASGKGCRAKAKRRRAAYTRGSYGPASQISKGSDPAARI